MVTGDLKDILDYNFLYKLIFSFMKMNLDREFCEEWTDENGKLVGIAPFFKTFYVDEEVKKLESKYNPYYRLKGIDNKGFHTSHETHDFAEKLARVYYSLENFVGFEISDLKTYAQLHQDIGEETTLLNMGFLRKKKVKGEIILFPTEKLIKLGFEKQKF